MSRSARVRRSRSGLSSQGGAMTRVAPLVRALRMSDKEASKSGESIHKQRLPGPSSKAAICWRMTAGMPPCPTLTPFAWPLEPEV